MNWYLQSGKDSDVVISTRIRYARNFRNHRFGIKDKAEAIKIEEEIKEKLPALGYGLKLLKLKDMDDLTKMSLLEKNIISPECAMDKKEICDILINDEENICVILNEEEHMKLQVFSGSFDLDGIFNLAKEIDQKMEETFDIAKSKKYGYLTNKPTEVGTGLRASVMVHLPGLSKTGNIRKILDSVSSFGLNIRGVYGENSKSSGDMYQISNKQTLGISEDDIIKNLKVITEKIIEQERTARRILAKNQILLEDMVYRSFGILSNCKKISAEETRNLLSDVKLGTDLGIIKEITDSKILQIYLYSKPANLQKKLGQNLDTFDRDIKRAEIIKEIIKT
ncbi:MAG: ATP--guanido phosphotransferase [Clostridia bacterium]|nr:ATP--guanido phosphotransferase [Clostridia bacterium]